MWIGFNNLASLFSISADTVSVLREENASLKTANTLLEKELLASKVNLDWLRMQYNQLQMERADLLGKMYGIRTAVPELTTAPKRPDIPETLDIFSDVGDDEARKLGLPVYGIKLS